MPNDETTPDPQKVAEKSDTTRITSVNDHLYLADTPLLMMTISD
jgi:hypothetical protein